MDNKKTKLRLAGDEPIIEITNLTKRFNGTAALNKVNLEIPRGRIVGIMGANGAGKTTLFKILAGLYREYDGEVLIGGQKPGTYTKGITAFLPDEGGIPSNITVNETIKFYKTFYYDFNEEKCRRLLSEMDLNPEKRPDEMSKGMIEKVMLCLLLSRNAELFVLDEPIAGVDIEARDRVLDAILNNYNSNGTMLISTHLVNEIERLFDSVIVIREGEIACYEDTDKLRELHGGSLEEALKTIFREGVRVV